MMFAKLVTQRHAAFLEHTLHGGYHLLHFDRKGTILQFLESLGGHSPRGNYTILGNVP